MGRGQRGWHAPTLQHTHSRVARPLAPAGMYVYKTQWKLPQGYTCDHCKLQMQYLTGSRCWPPAIKGVSLKKTVPYKYCNEKGATYPEVCAGLAVGGWLCGLEGRA